MEEGGLFHRMKRIFQVEEEMDEDTVKEAAGLIRNIFRYMDKDAKDIMTHRKNIVAVDGNEPLEVALKFMLEEVLITQNADGSYTANGMMDLEDLEDVIFVKFEKEEYETLNGFLIDQLDRIPGEDEQCVVEYEGYRFTVLFVDNNTIQRVKIEKRSEE